MNQTTQPSEGNLRLSCTLKSEPLYSAHYLYCCTHTHSRTPTFYIPSLLNRPWESYLATCGIVSFQKHPSKLLSSAWTMQAKLPSCIDCKLPISPLPICHSSSLELIADMVLNRLMNQVVTTTPTIGSNVEQVEYKNIKFLMWVSCRVVVVCQGQNPLLHNNLLPFD